MEPLWLRIRAPFAAYRPLQAGALRATAPVMTYSAAWGLLLNLAGIETRKGLEKTTTDIDPAAPPLRLALGLPGTMPGRGSLFQQAHAYPIGKDASKNLAARCHGAKFHITPVRRELLVDLDLVLGACGSGVVLDRIHMGLRGSGDWPRYGLPFAGDNNLLFDRMDILDKPPECAWYVPVDIQGPPAKGATRLTLAIDRTDNSQTRAVLVSPSTTRNSDPPTEAWHWTPREPERS